MSGQSSRRLRKLVCGAGHPRTSPSERVGRSAPNGILYIAGDERSCAANLRASEWLVAGFTKKYSVKRLVYFEHHETIQAAIQREHNMKHWSRKWKVRLVRANNPERHDLYETIV